MRVKFLTKKSIVRCLRSGREKVHWMRNNHSIKKTATNPLLTKKNELFVMKDDQCDRQKGLKRKKKKFLFALMSTILKTCPFKWFRMFYSILLLFWSQDAFLGMRMSKNERLGSKQSFYSILIQFSKFKKILGDSSRWLLSSFMRFKKFYIFDDWRHICSALWVLLAKLLAYIRLIKLLKSIYYETLWRRMKREILQHKWIHFPYKVSISNGKQTHERERVSLQWFFNAAFFCECSR